MRFTYVAADGTSSLTFDRTSSDYRLLKGYDGISTLNVAHQTARAPYQDGVTRLDTAAVERRVTIPIMVIGSSLENLQSKMQTLVNVLNPLAGAGYLYFEKEDGNSYYLNVIANNTPMVDPANRGLNHQACTIEFIAHDPFWYGSTQARLTLDPSGHPQFPFYGIQQSGTYYTKHIMGANAPGGTAVNAGNWPAPITGVIYGPMSDPVITNTTTAEYISFDITMTASDEYIRFTTGYGQQTCEYYASGSTTPANGFQYVNIGSTFFELAAGTNEIELSNSSFSGAATAYIEWWDKYTGV